MRLGARRSFSSAALARPMPHDRLLSLRKKIESQEVVRILEVHNGLTGLIAEHASATRPDGTEVAFDGMWSSSLTASASMGKPDIETVTTSQRLTLVQDSLDVSGKPMIYDGDTGGAPEIFHFTVRSLEAMGVSACIIEDKTGLKQNSLFGTERKQQLASIEDFCNKIRVGQAAKMTDDFMIIARIEALIAGHGEKEALKRAEAFIAAGADAIMIHSKEESPREVLSFLASYSKFETKVPVVTVPTTYNTITEKELVAAGSSIIIYANHMLRAAYPSMLSVAESILAHSRSKEADNDLLPVKRIITLIDDNTGMNSVRSRPHSKGTYCIGATGRRGFSSGPAAQHVRAGLHPSALLHAFQANGIEYYAGVPDSLLKDFCGYVSDHARSAGLSHTITANEGAAIAMAAGHHLATRKLPLVYMQNSGLGNAVNPLLSLADPKVYAAPMILLIGWRGRPGEKDEPQHVAQGACTEDMLAAMGIPFTTLPGNAKAAADVVATLCDTARTLSRPVALLVKRDTFYNYRMTDAVTSEASLTREDALSLCIAKLGGNDTVVSTTGYTSREVFELRKQTRKGHERDFLTVGSMGHASAIALGVATAKKSRNVYCFDGDGAAIMHMGNMATVGMSGAKNFKHIINNNHAHDSVGGQPTGTELLDFPAAARALGYTWSARARTEAEVNDKFAELQAHHGGPGMLEICVRPGARQDLGRPTRTPVANKNAFMVFLEQ